jgi:hypothetical protein
VREVLRRWAVGRQEAAEQTKKRQDDHEHHAHEHHSPSDQAAQRAREKRAVPLGADWLPNGNLWKRAIHV